MSVINPILKPPVSRRANRRPLIGITADANADKFIISRSYCAMVDKAGGLPLILPCLAERAAEFVEQCDGIILTGGDDPITTHWGVPMHPKSKPIDPQRQQFELALLEQLAAMKSKPVLGICLGMQLMGLHAGGKLNQHLPDTLATADLHWDKRAHLVSGELGSGEVHSHHRQALSDAGSLRVIAMAPDGVIEAVQRDNHSFYVGVQWHPERTLKHELGFDLFRRLVDACLCKGIQVQK